MCRSFASLPRDDGSPSHCSALASGRTKSNKAYAHWAASAYILIHRWMLPWRTAHCKSAGTGSFELEEDHLAAAGGQLFWACLDASAAIPGTRSATCHLKTPSSRAWCRRPSARPALQCGDVHVPQIPAAIIVVSQQTRAAARSKPSTPSRAMRAVVTIALLALNHQTLTPVCSRP